MGTCDSLYGLLDGDLPRLMKLGLDRLNKT